MVDPFAGSNITGEVAERLGRHWLAFELVEGYLEGSKFRFSGLHEQPFLFSMQAEALEIKSVGNDEIVSQPQLLESKGQYEADHKKKK